MVTKESIEQIYRNSGESGLKELFEKLPQDDRLKGLGILVILGVSYVVIEAIKEIVKS